MERSLQSEAHEGGKRAAKVLENCPVASFAITLPLSSMSPPSFQFSALVCGGPRSQRRDLLPLHLQLRLLLLFPKEAANKPQAPVRGWFPGLAVPPQGRSSLSPRLLPRSPCCSLKLSGTAASLHLQSSDHLLQRQNMIIIFRCTQSLM